MKFRNSSVLQRTALLLGAVALILFLRFFPQGLPSCPLYRLFGWYCGGCGCGRMLTALCHGAIGLAFRQNPLALLLLVFWAGYALVWRACAGVRRRIRGLRVFLLLSAGLLLGFGLLRNLPVLWFLRPI